MTLKQLQCTGERALRQRTLWKRGLFYAFLDVKLSCLKYQYFQEQSFFQLPEASLPNIPIWYILHTSKRLDHEGVVVFRPYFRCIFWCALSWQRGRKALSSSSVGRLSPTCCLWRRWRGRKQCCCASSLSLLPYFLFPSALGSSSTFFLSDSCLSHSP